MSGRLATCVCLVLLAGCAVELPSLAQAPASPENPPPVQLQPPRDESVTPAAATTTNKPAPLPGRVAVRIWATVNGVPILDNEVRQSIGPYMAQLQSLSEPERSVRLREAVRQELDRLIERELLIAELDERFKKNAQAERKLKEAAAKEADKQIRSFSERLSQQGIKVENEDDLKPYLAAQGLTLESLRRKLIRDFMAHEYKMHRVYPQIDNIGHKEVRQYYEEHPGEFQVEDRVKWLHIFISSNHPDHPDPASARRLAENIVRRAQAGEDFAQLAERYDNGFSKFAHGEGTGQRPGEIRPVEAEAYLFRMHEGTIGPVLDTATGCHVFKLVSREYAGLMPFDETTQALARRKLQGMVMQRESRRFMDELRRKATIRYYDNAP